MVLSQNMIRRVTQALSFAGEDSRPCELPILGAEETAILDVIPDTERDFQEIVAVLFGICDGVAEFARLKAPEVRTILAEVMVPKGGIFFVAGEGHRELTIQLRSVGFSILN